MMRAGSPLVSFVVPCYNYGRFLPDCLESIFGQNGGYDFEIVAVDDASTDNTLEVLERFRDPRLRVIRHEKNRGHVDTVNEGLRATRGEFVARIDPDDRYRSSFLKLLLPKFAEYPEVGLVYGNASLINADGKVTAETSDRVHKGRDFKGNELCALLIENYICAPTAIARRDAWLEAMPIPAGLAFNDWYFNLIMARRHDFCYVNQVVADYRVHSANHHSQIVANKSEEPSIRFVLDLVFGARESDPELERQKREARGRIYSSQYLTLANKYFGMALTSDARRCYCQAIRFSPAQAMSIGTMRRLAATFLPRNLYDAAKRLIFPRRFPAISSDVVRR
jgi:glycosyltransferase involved in cell wall biosynthesis